MLYIWSSYQCLMQDFASIQQLVFASCQWQKFQQNFQKFHHLIFIPLPPKVLALIIYLNQALLRQVFPYFDKFFELYLSDSIS
jgi:hypothetical protein